MPNILGEYTLVEHRRVGDVGAKKVFPYGIDGSTATVIKVDSAGNLYTVSASGLVPFVHDFISLSYTGSNLTGVVYKTGGSGGTTVATLALTYDGSNNLLTVTRT